MLNRKQRILLRLRRIGRPFRAPNILLGPFDLFARLLDRSSSPTGINSRLFQATARASELASFSV